jgi:hypothetical protein
LRLSEAVLYDRLTHDRRMSAAVCRTCQKITPADLTHRKKRKTMKSNIANDPDEITKLRVQFQTEFQRFRNEMESKLDALCEAVSARESGTPDCTNAEFTTEPTSRRGMLRRVGAMALGMATIGLLRPSNSCGGSGVFNGAAPDADGGNLILGQANDASSTTTLREDPPDSSFVVRNGSVNTLSKVVIQGLNSASNTPTPPGVFQNHFNNIAIFAGADGVGSTTPDNNMIGVAGSGTRPNNGMGRGIGVFGTGTDFGVFGSATAILGAGVVGTSDGSEFSVGVEGTSDLGLGGQFRGGRAAINLIGANDAAPNPNVTPPTGGEIGDLYRGPAANGGLGAGSLWFRTTDSNDSYRRLADETTAGSLSLLSAPLRVVDTRSGSGFFDAGNHYSNDTLRTYNIVSLANGSVITKATALVGRVTVVNASASGALQESPNPPPGSGNDLGPGTAVINFPPASVIAALGATFISALDASGQIRLHSVIGSGTLDVIIDIVGYFI